MLKKFAFFERFRSSAEGPQRKRPGRGVILKKIRSSAEGPQRKRPGRGVILRALGVCLPQPCPSAGRRFAVPRSRLNFY